MQNTPDPNVPTTATVVTSTEDGFSVQYLAAQQVQHIFVATSNFISTLIFLLSSAFALVVTVVAVIFIAILGILNGRIKGKNLLVQPPAK